MKNNVRKLTDGAMMCAIIGVFLLINRYLGGMFEDMFLYVFPLPMIFFSAKYGMKDSWAVIAAIMLLTVVIGTPQTIFYVGSESVLGALYGTGIRKKTDSKKLVLITVVVSVALNVFTTVIYASFFGYDLTSELTEMEGMMNQIMAQSGTSMPSTLNMSEFLKTVLIVSVLLTGILQGLVTHLLARVMLKRLRFDIPPSAPLRDYYPPIWSGYLGFAGMAMYLYSSMKPFADQMMQNVFQGLGMCGLFYLLGYGTVALVLLGSLRNPAARKWIILPVLALALFMSLPVSVFGFLYITTDMHRKWLGGNTDASKAE